MVMNVDAVRLPQAPSAVIMTEALLLVPPASPGLPPVAVTYIRVELDGQV